MSSALLAKRAKVKASGLYNNKAWDLVDAVEEGEVKLEQLSKEALPAPMVNMSPQQQQAFIASKKAEREQLREEIKRLSMDRDDYVNAKQKVEVSAPTVSDALLEAIQQQAEKKSYTLR